MFRTWKVAQLHDPPQTVSHAPTSPPNPFAFSARPSETNIGAADWIGQDCHSDILSLEQRA